MRKIHFVSLTILGLALVGCAQTDTSKQAAKSDVVAMAPVTALVRYLPEFTASGELVLPKNFEKWVYVGSPLTPNALNGGKANFPEFHNVYVEPVSYDHLPENRRFPGRDDPVQGTAIDPATTAS